MADENSKTESPTVPASPTETKTATAKGSENNDSGATTTPEEPVKETTKAPNSGSDQEKTSSSEDKGKAAGTTASNTEQDGEIRPKPEVEEDDDDDDDDDLDIENLTDYDRRRFLRSVRYPYEYDSWYGQPPPSPGFIGPPKETLRSKTSRMLDENTLPWTKFKPPIPKPACIVFHNAQRYLLEDKETRIPRGLEIKDNMKTLLATARREPFYPGGQYPMICFVNDEENVGLSFTDAYVEKRVVYPLAGNEDISELTAAKSKGSKFFRRDNQLADLKSKGVEKIFIVGGPSDRDIIWSCKGARKLGFEVTLISGCHGAFDSEDEWHWEIERRIEQEARDLGCEVVPFYTISLDWEMDGVVN